MFEYEFFSSVLAHSLLDMINSAGLDRWKLISITWDGDQYVAFMMREIK